MWKVARKKHYFKKKQIIIYVERFKNKGITFTSYFILHDWKKQRNIAISNSDIMDTIVQPVQLVPKYLFKTSAIKIIYELR